MTDKRSLSYDKLVDQGEGKRVEGSNWRRANLPHFLAPFPLTYDVQSSLSPPSPLKEDN